MVPPVERAKNKRCEDCQLVSASCGLLAERKSRWCPPCGVAYGSVYQSEWQDTEKVKAKVDRAARVRRERRTVAKEAKLRREEAKLIAEERAAFRAPE